MPAIKLNRFLLLTVEFIPLSSFLPAVNYRTAYITRAVGDVVAENGAFPDRAPT